MTLFLTILIEFFLAVAGIASLLNGRPFEGILCTGLVILIFFYTLTV